MTSNYEGTAYFCCKSNNTEFTIFYTKQPLIRTYSYERGVEEVDDIITVHFSRDCILAKGECSPLPSFFNVDVSVVLNQLEDIAHMVCSYSGHNDKADILEQISSGPARNAIDSVLLDFECKRNKTDIWTLLGLRTQESVSVYHTLELDSIGLLFDRLQEIKSYVRKLKLKLGSTNDDIDRLKLVRDVIPNCELIIDVNEGWDFKTLMSMIPFCEKYDVLMIEQPLPRGADKELKSFKSLVPIFADESFHTVDQLPEIAKCYDGVNIKLDKIGGLTAALDAIEKAKALGLDTMIGCLGGSSLSSAPGYVAAQKASFVDLDNHLWLQFDRHCSLGGLVGHMASPAADLWG